MKLFKLTIILLSFSFSGFTQSTDSLLIGEWQLFKIIDNMTGIEIPITHKSLENPSYIIKFDGTGVWFNLEINKCTNSYTITGRNKIEFTYYDSCTEICCDESFSEYLTYDQCTGYYIQQKNRLILVSEDRMYYFTRVTPN